TIRAPARAVGLSERTISRRLADPDFRREVSRLRSDMIQRALGKMAATMSRAADTLRRLLSADSDSIRLSAVRSLLELGTKLRESTELEERLTALEERITRVKAS